MPMTTAHLQAIQQKLKSIRVRYYLLVLMHFGLLYGASIWLSHLGQLAFGFEAGALLGWALIIPLGYVAYRLYRCPSLSRIAHLADERCHLQDELITAWQYRDSSHPTLPLLLREVFARLDEIKPSLIFSLKVSRRWLVVPVILLGLNWYAFNLSSLPEDADPTTANQLTALVDQMQDLQDELAKTAPDVKLLQLAKTTERLQQLAQELENPAAKAYVIPKLEELKQELAKSITNNATQGDAGEQEPALLELEVKSEWMIKLLRKLEKKGFSSEDIQNQILREVFDILERLIQVNAPGGGSKPGEGTEMADAGAGGGAPEPLSLQALGVFDSKYDEQGGRPADIDQSGWDAYRFSPQREVEEIVSKKDYTYLPVRYQEQVNSVLADQQIPIQYRRHVRDYFDALN